MVLAVVLSALAVISLFTVLWFYSALPEHGPSMYDDAKQIRDGPK